MLKLEIFSDLKFGIATLYCFHWLQLTNFGQQLQIWSTFRIEHNMSRAFRKRKFSQDKSVFYGYEVAIWLQSTPETVDNLPPVHSAVFYAQKWLLVTKNTT